MTQIELKKEKIQELYAAYINELKGIKKRHQEARKNVLQILQEKALTLTKRNLRNLTN